MTLKKYLSIVILILFSVIMPFLLCGCTSEKNSRKTIIKSTDTALLTIFTFDGKKESSLGLMNLGHSFLSLENISDKPIKIANKTVSPNETIAIGTWSIQAHFGVWYNVESNYISDYNKYDGRLSITTGITDEDIETMTEYILAHDYWTPLENCSCFALNLWNEVVEDSEKLDKMLIYSPSGIASQLRQFDTFEENKEILTDDKFYYFDATTPVYYELEDNYASV